jgi:hypothetical protein
MANGSNNPFPLSEMMTQGFEQTRKAMESYLDFFQKNITASPLLDTDLNKKMKTYTEQNIAAVSEFSGCAGPRCGARGTRARTVRASGSAPR